MLHTGYETEYQRGQRITVETTTTANSKICSGANFRLFSSNLPINSPCRFSKNRESDRWVVYSGGRFSRTYAAPVPPSRGWAEQNAITSTAFLNQSIVSGFITPLESAERNPLP